MKKIKDTEFVCCKNCKFYKYEKINDYSEMWSCLKNNSINNSLSPLEDKPCFQKKRFKRFFKKKN